MREILFPCRGKQTADLRERDGPGGLPLPRREENHVTPLLAPDDAALLRDLGSCANEAAETYLAAARRTLRQLVAKPGLFDGVPLERVPSGFTRNLVYGGDEISIWAMVWSPGAKTPIHDHHCSCCFGIVKGTLSELWFRPIDAARAVPVGAARRDPGFIACMMPSGPNVHQMINEGPEEAISLHIYGYDHTAHASSVARTYEIAPG
jgi:predicted metal-dependent enzyme (double-stranded beta helix superfamily)